jgi:hypothetical protein
MRVLAIVASFVLLWPPWQGGAAQQPPTGSIEGAVVERDTGVPIARANVELRRAQGSTRSAQTFPIPAFGTEPVAADSLVFTTAADGKFVFRDVPAGSYRLYATRSSGHVPGEYGQRTATGAGVPFTLSAGQRMSGVPLVMTPAASITGFIVDANGEPSGYAHVQALKAMYRDGHRTLTVAQLVQADDRGSYRLFWLPPGEYFVCAKPLDLRRSSEMMHIPPPSRFGRYEQQMRPTVTAINTSRVLEDGSIAEEQYVPICYPGTRDDRRASPIRVAAGQSVGGVNLSVADSLVRTHRIRGQIVDGSTGQPLAGASLQVIPRNPPAILLIPTGTSNPDGTFDMWGALPGPDYLVVAGRGMNGLRALDVSGADVNGVTVTVWPAISIPGRIVVGDRSAVDNDPDVTGVTVTLRRTPPINGLPEPSLFGGGRFARAESDGTFTLVTPAASPLGNTSNADGAFSLNGVPPGDYTVVVAAKNDSYVESIRLANRDVLNDGIHVDGPLDSEARLEVVIGARGGALEGRVVNRSRESVVGATVVAIPDMGRGRTDLYKNALSDASGAFRLSGLAPGSYEILAWDEIAPGAWHDADVLRGDEGRGRRVRVDAGSKGSIEVTVIPAR